MAEDVVQHVFARLWEFRSELHVGISLKNYLFTMTKNHVLNLIRNENSAISKNYEIAQSTPVYEDNLIENLEKKEYIKLMEFLTSSQMPLSELILCSDDQYNSIKEKITISERRYHIFDVLDKTRSIILNKKPGFNIILYLLYQLRNKVIKISKS